MREEWWNMNNKQVIWIAIDDTDNLESIGTGRLARNLAKALRDEGLAECESVTRHQLLVDPRIPYTSHNSSACLELLAPEGPLDGVIEFCAKYLRDNYHEGADPGLCVAPRNGQYDLLSEFGIAAQRDVVDVETAYSVASKRNVHLSAHGGTGLGGIGALAAVGLRNTRNDGRFLDLKGIRDVDGMLSVKNLLASPGIKNVRSTSGENLGDENIVDTRGWVRPDLMDGVPTLLVEKISEDLWRTLKSRKKGDEG